MAFQPDKAIPPGQIIARTLAREGMTQKNLSERTGLTEKHLSQMINGEASITVETALLLENALGGSASFWINLEKNYQETKARLERVSLLAKEAPLLDRFPYAELVRRKCVEQTSDKTKRVENLWKFFGVNSLTFVQATEPVAYRQRADAQVKTEWIAAWLRCGELQGKEQPTEEYSEVALRQTLPKLRQLTLRKPEQFSVEAQKLLAKVGVTLVYIPHIPGTGVSGAVRWVGRAPLIQLSLLGAYADIFWFNLFHEIGHLLLHGKKEKFIEFDKRDLSAAQEKEQEADRFATEALIPSASYEKFIAGGIFSATAVRRFSEDVGIDAGIVEGRLCHEGKVPWSKPLGFRLRLKFAE